MVYPYGYPYYQNQQYQHGQTMLAMRVNIGEHGVQVQQLPVEVRFSGVCRYDPATGKYICDISATKNFGLNGYEVRTARIEVAPGNLELVENVVRGAIGGLLEEIEERTEQVQTIQKAVQQTQQLAAQRPHIPQFLL